MHGFDATQPHRELDDLLGRWHDLEAACTLLAQDLEKHDWPSELAAMGSQVLQAWQARERRVRKTVLKQMRLACPA